MQQTHSLPAEARAALPNSAQLRSLLDETVQEITTAGGLVDDLPYFSDGEPTTSKAPSDDEA